MFICGWYPSRVLPTNGDFIERHAQAVAKQHKVSVIHLITDKNCTKKIEIITKEDKNLTTHIAYILPQKNTLTKLKSFWKAYQQILKKVGPFDVIHLNEIHPFGLLAKHTSKKNKVTYIITEHHTAYLQTTNNYLSYSKKMIAKNVVKHAAFFCPVSTYLATHLKKGGFTGNYKIVPNVVDTGLFVPQKKVRDSLKIVHVSSLKDSHKNIKGMLRVAKLLEEKLAYFEWHFIGGTGNEYQDFITSLNIKKAKIHFTNHVSQKQLVNYLQEATLCVSFSNYETFGIVIPEAIACGTPVIATNTGIATYLKNEQFCKVIPIKNEALLLEEILNYKTNFDKLDPDKMHSFVAQQFSKEVISNKFSQLYYKSLNI